MDDKKKNRSIEDCIIENVHECKNPVWQIVPYLCGQAAYCRNRTEQAVAQAKKNVETKYFAVGILEELGMFLKFLEYGLPEYFAGSTEILSSKIGKITNQQSCTCPSRLSITSKSIRKRGQNFCGRGNIRTNYVHVYFCNSKKLTILIH